MATSGAELWTAWGTVGAAVAAAAGLAVALRINRKDRTQAEAGAAADRRGAREDERRRLIVANLLELGRQYGLYATASDPTRQAPTAQRLRLLLHALPADCAYVVRHEIIAWDADPRPVSDKVGEKLGLAIPPPSSR